MIKRVLVANRGEIAVRVIRACIEMGIETVAVYSDADKENMHVYMADKAICIGPYISSKSYLNMTAILTAAKITGCDAVHPGFGFLSENPRFALLCKESGLIFIGPSSETMDIMGNKSLARENIKKAGIQVVPGSNGIVNSPFDGLQIAREIGYPVIIKASNGGGGKGMRIVRNSDEFSSAFEICKKEALVSFGDDSLYIEKFIENPRHIEFQIIADSFGNIVHLGERDCTLQRKNQKVMEESPAVILDESLRKKMGEAAIKASLSCGYENAGTVEFLLDKDNKFYFMEMNTRIQVEHPVSEMVTGIDIVKEQIKVASLEKMNFTQGDIKINGHSIECRINAESPSNNFRPSPGTIKTYHTPGGFGVRIDSCVYEGYTIPPYYDSMIAKLIVHGNDRGEALEKMKRALSEFVVEGVDTNIEFLIELLNERDIKLNNYNTSFIENFIKGKGGR